MAHALPSPSGLTPKGYTSLLMQAQGWLRILAEKRASWRYLTSQRLSGKFHDGNDSRWSSPNFQFFPRQLQKELRTVTYLVAGRASADMLANNWYYLDKILLVHNKKGGGNLMEIGEGNKATWSEMFNFNNCPGTAGWVLWDSNLRGLHRPRIDCIFQWLTLTWVRNWTIIGGEKVYCKR